MEESEAHYCETSVKAPMSNNKECAHWRKMLVKKTAIKIMECTRKVKLFDLKYGFAIRNSYVAQRRDEELGEINKEHGV